MEVEVVKTTTDGLIIGGLIILTLFLALCALDIMRIENHLEDIKRELRKLGKESGDKNTQRTPKYPNKEV